MSANIKLTRFASTGEVPDAIRQVWPIKILAQGINIDDNIFVYHIGKNGDPIPGDKFECVASVNQLQELPIGNGITVDVNNGIPFYRTNILEFACRSATEAERIWTSVVEEVQLLVANFNSALTLQETQFVAVDATGIVSNELAMIPPIVIAISAHPAGSVVVDMGKQGITTPDASLSGWLPVSAAPIGIVKPPGSVFFYNIDLDPTLKAVWPPKDPLSGNQLTRNGLVMPYGIVWALSDLTIWWLDFNPANIPGYQRVSPQSNDGNAPWALDYVSPSNPGAVQPSLRLTLFK